MITQLQKRYRWLKDNGFSYDSTTTKYDLPDRGELYLDSIDTKFVMTSSAEEWASFRYVIETLEAILCLGADLGFIKANIPKQDLEEEKTIHDWEIIFKKDKVYFFIIEYTTRLHETYKKERINWIYLCYADMTYHEVLEKFKREKNISNQQPIILFYKCLTE